PGARFLNAAVAGTAYQRACVSVGVGLAGLVLTVLLAWFAPITLPYRPLVTYVFTLNSLALISFGLLCPIAARGLGRLVGRVANPTRGVGLRLAGRSISRNPAGPVAAVTAIVLGLGWTLADASLIESFRGSWLDWVDRHYRSDLVVSAGPA